MKTRWLFLAALLSLLDPDGAVDLRWTFRSALTRRLDMGALRLDGGSYHANVQFTPDRLQLNGIAVSP